jgi:hypothetical protein
MVPFLLFLRFVFLSLLFADCSLFLLLIFFCLFLLFRSLLSIIFLLFTYLFSSRFFFFFSFCLLIFLLSLFSFFFSILCCCSRVSSCPNFPFHNCTFSLPFCLFLSFFLLSFIPVFLSFFYHASFLLLSLVSSLPCPPLAGSPSPLEPNFRHNTPPKHPFMFKQYTTPLNYSLSNTFQQSRLCTVFTVHKLYNTPHRHTYNDS